MTKKTKDDDDQIGKLRSAIASLTGKTPHSRSLRYLSDRLADLEARKKSGEDVRRPTAGELAVTRSFSLPTLASKALDDLLEKENVSASELVRQALAMFAKKRGHRAEAIAMGE